MVAHGCIGGSLLTRFRTPQEDFRGLVLVAATDNPKS